MEHPRMSAYSIIKKFSYVASVTDNTTVSEQKETFTGCILIWTLGNFIKRKINSTTP